jgi:uncharacterized membrane protein YqhA
VHKSTLGSEHIANEQIAWMLAIRMTFIFSGVLFAVMDYIAGKSNPHY